MALDLTVFATDATNIIADMPASLVFGAVTVSVCKSEQSKSHDLELAGYNVDTDLEVMGVVADFTAGVPGPGQEVTVDGTVYKVERKQISPCDKVVNLFLMES